jgi:hypothetical protein
MRKLDRLKPVLLFTESATENRPPAKQHGGIPQVNLQDVFPLLASLGKGEKVG